jgi:hypothetical protein
MTKRLLSSPGFQVLKHVPTPANCQVAMVLLLMLKLFAGVQGTRDAHALEKQSNPFGRLGPGKLLRCATKVGFEQSEGLVNFFGADNSQLSK